MLVYQRVYLCGDINVPFLKILGPWARPLGQRKSLQTASNLRLGKFIRHGHHKKYHQKWESRWKNDRPHFPHFSTFQPFGDMYHINTPLISLKTSGNLCQEGPWICAKRPVSGHGRPVLRCLGHHPWLWQEHAWLRDGDDPHESVRSPAILIQGGCHFNDIYTLWWTNILPWKITIVNRKIHYIWPFSIAMLVCQRVYESYWIIQDGFFRGGMGLVNRFFSSG